jgi:hypothetical protein
VIDPNEASLKAAKERYEGFVGIANHPVRYSKTIEANGPGIHIVIIATNSNCRRAVLEQVLGCNKVKYFILEKYLFDKKPDYYVVEKLLAGSGATAWVNCSMRKMPFYAQVKDHFRGQTIDYSVTGSQYGLVTNLVHYIDHLAYLTDCVEYEVDTAYLEREPIASKRKGFLEFNGLFQAHFKNGSHGTFRCYPSGDLPVQIEIVSDEARCISREWDGKAWISQRADGWKWREVDAKVPYQSQMTTELVEEILRTGSCPLPSYEDSMKIHMPLLGGLLEHLNKHSVIQYDYYPFT